MRDQREIVGFLDRARREHRPAGRSRVHDVAVVAEDREGMRRDRPGRDMDDRRRQLARDLEHVGDHQEQALRRRERRGQCALLECPVERSGRARLGLHLHDVRDLAPQVRPARRRPVVTVFGHGGGRRDRVDRDHFADRVGDAGRRLVTVQTLVPMVHGGLPSGIRLAAGSRPGRPDADAHQDHDYPPDRPALRGRTEAPRGSPRRLARRSPDARRGRGCLATGGSPPSGRRHVGC